MKHCRSARSIHPALPPALLALAALGFIGCSGHAGPPPSAAPAPGLLSTSAQPATRPAAGPVAPSTPFLVHLPGVAGESRIDHNLLAGLESGGVEAKVEIYDWTCNDPGVPALRAYARNQAQAAIISEHITRQFRADPRGPIYLTSHSGGGAMAVWALEKLPADVMVEGVLLLAPALSPGYDLTAALRHVKGRAYVFSSPLDAVVLGAGTRLFGTMDGPREDAAGMVGFTRPDAGDATQYQKLVPRPYQDEWLKLGNDGDHIGVTHTRFAREILAPLLRR